MLNSPNVALLEVVVEGAQVQAPRIALLKPRHHHRHHHMIVSNAIGGQNGQRRLSSHLELIRGPQVLHIYIKPKTVQALKGYCRSS